MAQYSETLAKAIAEDLLSEFDVSDRTALTAKIINAVVTAHHLPHDRPVSLDAARLEAGQLLAAHSIGLAAKPPAADAADYLEIKLMWRLVSAYQYNLPEHHERHIDVLNSRSL